MNRITQAVAFVGAATIAFILSTASLAQTAAIEDRSIQSGEQTFRYLSAGSDGPPIVLLHGWPQSADEFRHIIPDLAESYTVYAPDLSGIGGSTARGERWDKETLAGDIKGFIEFLDLEMPLIVGHDIGGMVAYAYGRLYPDEVSGIGVLDVPIPGLAPWDDVAGSSHAWHFDFHNQAGLAEALVEGNQMAYFRDFIDSTAANPEAISNDKVALYAEAYDTIEQLQAGFEFYRAFEEDAAFFLGQDEAFDVPILVLGGELSMQATLPVMAESYAAQGATNVTTVAIAGAGHWLAEEQPQLTIKAIEQFAATVFNP